jgi:hypothetical protein
VQASSRIPRPIDPIGVILLSLTRQRDRSTGQNIVLYDRVKFKILEREVKPPRSLRRAAGVDAPLSALTHLIATLF